MRRLFYVALGATVGVLVVRKLSRTAESLSPSGLASGVGGLGRAATDAWRAFTGDVLEAMAERESELRATFGIDGSAAASGT